MKIQFFVAAILVAGLGAGCSQEKRNDGRGNKGPEKIRPASNFDACTPGETLFNASPELKKIELRELPSGTYVIESIQGSFSAPVGSAPVGLEQAGLQYFDSVEDSSLKTDSLVKCATDLPEASLGVEWSAGLRLVATKTNITVFGHRKGAAQIRRSKVAASAETVLPAHMVLSQFNRSDLNEVGGRLTESNDLNEAIFYDANSRYLYVVQQVVSVDEGGGQGSSVQTFRRVDHLP